MADLFICALLGHLIGDFLLQPSWLAYNKRHNDKTGLMACSLHVLIYTLAVCVMLGNANPIVWVLVFVPHWVIDHWFLGEKWSELIRGRTLNGVLKMSGLERELGFSFYGLVCVGVDNTWHLLCLYVTIKYFIL